MGVSSLIELLKCLCFFTLKTLELVFPELLVQLCRISVLIAVNGQATDYLKKTVAPRWKLSINQTQVDADSKPELR